MSSWRGWGNYLQGRLSPFARSPASGGEVSDAAFSYITSEDLKRNAVERSHGDNDEEQDGDEADGGAEARHHHHQYHPKHRHAHNRDHGNGSSSSKKDLETDVLIIRHRAERYTVHFPAFSIDEGTLRIGDIRAQAAKKANADAKMVRLFYKGTNLKDDGRLARDVGLESGRESEILCVAGGDSVPQAPLPACDDSDEGESEEGDEIDDRSGGGAKKKKKKQRKSGSKKKKSSSSSSAAASNGYVTPPPTGTSTFIPPSAIPRSTSSTPAPSTATATPQTPLDKINGLDIQFRHTLVPLCSTFVERPPAEKAKRDFEYKKLSETVMQQILLKLDGVEVEGDSEARQRRKEVIKDVQGWLTKLDNSLKG